MTVSGDRVIVPPAWRELDVARWCGPVVIVGGTDSGKTTFARCLHRRYVAQGEATAFIDLDPGQNAFGLPTTAALGMGADPAEFPPQALRRHIFVGGNTPVRHEARVLAALHRLARIAEAEGARRLIVDTSGFIDVAHGAADLKWAKVDLLRPCTVVALQQEAELAPILAPWRHRDDVELIVLPVSEHVRARSREVRRAYRAQCYRRYFEHAPRHALHFADIALYATGAWARHQVVALEDAAGCVLALALIEKISEAVIWLRTPLSDADHGAVAALRMGSMGLDPVTFEDYAQGSQDE